MMLDGLGMTRIELTALSSTMAAVLTWVMCVPLSLQVSIAKDVIDCTADRHGNSPISDMASCKVGRHVNA